MSNEFPTVLPKAIIDVSTYKETYEVGGNDNASFIREMNFYSSLNSFAFNADVTIEDCDNEVLNRLAEQNASKVALLLYELPKKTNDKLTVDVAKKVFQKTFAVDKIDVLEFGKTYPYKSVIKIHLVDTFDALFLNEIKTFSNFNVKWKSKQMSPIETMHALLKSYESVRDDYGQSVGRMQIDEKIFGVNIENLKRRFATDQSTSMRDVFFHYMEQLYNTRYKEFLSFDQPIPLMPTCLLAYTNQYKIDKYGILRRIPWLTCANLLDTDPNKPFYSVPYPKTGKILDFARKDYNVNVADTSIDFRGGPGCDAKEKFIADKYRKYTYNSRIGYFEDDMKHLEEMFPICPNTFPDIESQQEPKYLGIGEDPKFSQMDNVHIKTYTNYPYNIKDNRFYFSNGDGSFYRDACEMFLKPIVYVAISNSAFHSPGQEIDLRMITSNYENFKPDKDTYFSMNKLISGRWKIVNSISKFRQQKDDGSGTMNIMPVEVLGLTRTRYFHGELPPPKDKK